MFRRWFDYRIKTRAALTLPDPDLAWAVVEPVWQLPTPADSSVRRHWRWRFVTTGQIMVYSATWLERELLNGGYAQYFANPWGHFYADAAHALREFGLPEHAQLLGHAGALFPGGIPPLRRDQRQVCISGWAHKAISSGQADADAEELTVVNDVVFSDIYNRFLDLYGDGTAYYARMGGYVRSHPSEFFQ